MQESQTAPGASESADDALIACLTEIERFVASSSRGGPPRLYALVRTVDLVKAEPALAGQLAIGNPDSLSSIEQDDFRPGEDLAQALATTTWGDAVDGAAICVERIFLPDDCADEMPKSGQSRSVCSCSSETPRSSGGGRSASRWKPLRCRASCRAPRRTSWLDRLGACPGISGAGDAALTT